MNKKQVPVDSKMDHARDIVADMSLRGFATVPDDPTYRVYMSVLGGKDSFASYYDKELGEFVYIDKSIMRGFIRVAGQS